MNTQELFSKSYAKSLQDRFIRYVKVYTESISDEADKGIQPSAAREADLAKILNDEMKALGLLNVQTTEYCYTYGLLPATKGMENVKPFCLLAHIDTVEEVTGKDVKPIIHENYDGKPITLPSGIVLDPAVDKHLALAGTQNDTIISSDGSTLLGADDKAGIAEIMTAIAYLTEHPEISHGPIEVIFSPDEETGHGMDHVPLDLMKSKYAYTVDGGHYGELEKECFNAWKSDITFTGKSKHPGDARPDMVNAVNMAAAFITALPHNEMPETTDGYMGFYGPMYMEASVDSAKINLILRDFTREGIDKKIKVVDTVANAIAESFGGKAEVVHTMQYLNMKEGLDKSPFVTENLIKAYEASGITPTFPPIRGGTDGSRLTEMGIPTPNIFTGGHCYHSRYEWASFSQMIAATEVLINLAQFCSK